MTGCRDRSQDTRSSRSPGSARGRSAPWCSPTWAPTSIRVDRAQSVARRRPRRRRRPTCSTGAGARSASTSRTPTASRPCSRLVEQADALIEGFRPGVAERLGIGPDVCLARNPKLVYGRMTGWGQDGPYAHDRRPRHQLHRAGRRARPHRPAGRGARAAAQPGRRLRRRRHAARLRHRVRACSRPQRSGEGQVVDAAMVDGAAAADDDVPRASGPWASGTTTRGTNLLDTGAHFYDVYETRRRRVRLDRVDRAAVLRRAAAASPASRARSCRGSMDKAAVAGA